MFNTNNMEAENKKEQNPLGALSKDLQEYVQVQTDILRLEVTGKLASGSANMTLLFVIALILFVLAIFLGLSLAVVLSNWLGSYVKGFLIVTGILFLKLLFIIIFRKGLILNPIRNMIIRQSLQSQTPEDEN